LGRSGFQMREFAASLQDTFVPLGFARDTASQLSRNLVELSEDVASFQNKATPDVMRDFQSALVGNHETVRKYGIIITQERLDQKIEAMAKSSAAFASQSQEMQKVLARNKIIFEGTTDAQGDATRTSGSLTNQFRALRARVKDMSITLGNTLVPIIRPLIKQLNEWLVQNRDIIKSGFDSFVNGLVISVKVLVGAVRIASKIFGAFRFILGEIITSFTDSAIVSWIKGLMEANGWLDAIVKKIDKISAAMGLGPTVEEAIETSRSTDTDLETRRRALERTRQNLVQLREQGVQSVRGIQLDDAGIDRLVGLAGNRMQRQMAPAAAGNNVRNMNAQANITVNVPAGTPATQAQRVAEAAGAATRTSMRQAIGDVAR
jgi:hypothetical protein